MSTDMRMAHPSVKAPELHSLTRKHHMIQRGQLHITVATLAALLTEVQEDLHNREETLQYTQADLQSANREVEQLQQRLETSQGELLKKVKDLRSKEIIISDMQTDLRRWELKYPTPTQLDRDAAKLSTLERQNSLLMSLLARFHSEKIAIIKRVREITQWGLKESKDFVESYPWPQQAHGEIAIDSVPSDTIADIIRQKLGARNPELNGDNRARVDVGLDPLPACGDCRLAPTCWELFPVDGQCPTDVEELHHVEDGEPSYFPPALNPALASSNRPPHPSASDLAYAGINPTTVSDNDIPF